MATAAKKTNGFAVWISVAVVAVLVVVGALVVWMNNAASAPAEPPQGAGINASTGAIEVGTGSNEIDIWFDFYCPHCQDFEEQYGPTVNQLVEAGTAKLNLYPVALTGLNAASGTDFSKRSANAMYCIATQNADAAYTFMQNLFAMKVTGAGPTDQELISMAASAGVTGIDDCITKRTYVSFIDSLTKKIPASPKGGQGTPTIVVNGEYVTLTGNPQADLVNRMN